MRGRRGGILTLGIVAVLVLCGADYSARTNYILHCQGCHGADGIGGLPEKVPPLRDSIGYFLHIPGGRRFLIQVPGVAHAPLTDAEIADLLNFSLQEYSAGQLPRPFQPFTQAEVARKRRESTDIVRLRAELVSEVLQRLRVRMWTIERPVVDQPGGAKDVAGNN